MDDQQLQRLMDKLGELTSALGRSAGGQTGGINQPNRPTNTASGGNTAKAKTSPAESLLDRRMRELEKQAKRQGGISESARKELEEWQKTQKDVNKLQDEQKDSYKDIGRGLRDFGGTLLREGSSLSGAMNSLSYDMKYSNSVMGRALGGMAAGFGFTLGVLENFAASAKDMGAFADLSAFKVGSVKQAKLMSGLGDSFIKVIADSNGGFKAFGSNSQKATENLSDLARGLRLGSYSINSSLQKALGPEYVKKMNKAAASTAAMGLSQEDQANLMGTLSSTIALTAKNEVDAQQKLVKQYAETVDSARTLSNTFGTSAKEILKSIENFKKSTSGQAAELQGVAGAADIKQALQAAGVSNNEEDLNRMALLMAKGQTGAASTYASPEAMANFQAVAAATDSARTRAGGLSNTQNLAQGMQEQRGVFEEIGRQRGDLGAKGTEGLFDTGVAAATLAKKLELQAKAAAGDETAKKELAKGMGTTTEAGNIQAMDQLTGALNSLRNVILGLMAGIVGLTGAFGALALGGGLGALMGGGKGLVGALGEKLGGVLSKVPGVSTLGEKIGGLASKAGGMMGGAGSSAGASAAGGMFSKLGGAASSGMSAFGEFLGNLGDNKTVKGAGTLALLGGALALAAHGFKTFGEVKWEGMLKGTVALGGLILLARGIGEASTSMLKGAASIAILGGSLLISAIGFKTFNEVEWGSLIKGAAAIGVLGVAASLLGGMTANILIGALGIAALGAAMWVAGKGFASFNEVDWGSLIKGAVALGVFATAAVVLGGLVVPILLGSAAIAVLGGALAVFGLGAMVAAKAAQMFSEAIVNIGSIDGMNLVAIGAGLAAIGAGMILFTAGMLIGTASSVLTGIMGLFGAKSPLERIMSFVPYADAISKVGEGIKGFGEGVLAISNNIGNIDSDALGNFKDQMLEFAKAGSSDEMRITAENLTSIGTAIAQIAQAGDIKLPNLGDMSAGAVSGAGADGTNNADNSSIVTPEVIEQVLSYLSGMNSDLSAIRSNTKSSGFDAPVRLG
jgi:hypothetical protein